MSQRSSELSPISCKLQTHRLWRGTRRHRKEASQCGESSRNINVLKHSSTLNALKIKSDYDTVTSMASPDPLTLAADSSPKLLPLLRSNASLASTQDEHGYSLLHAAASYNHLDLLKTLVQEFSVDINIRDEDEETPLFVVETVAAAQLLAEELGADVTATNNDGQTAEEKILTEGENPTIAAYLKELRSRGITAEKASGDDQQAPPTGPFNSELHHPPPLPPNVTVNMGTMEEVPSAEALNDVDPEFRQRIEELAARDDFQGEEGQSQLRDLIKDAVRGVSSENDRDVRRRVE